MSGQNISTAVMARRHASRDEFDYYPTPPWGTRALCEFLGGRHYCTSLKKLSVWEPACGEGFMARPLAEYFGRVYASDIQDFSGGWAGQDAVVDFLFPGTAPADQPQWIISNPPFILGHAFVERALRLASVGVAMLVRTAFLEGGARYRELYASHPPAAILQFSERIDLVKGRCDPDANSATAYCWLIWDCESNHPEEEPLGPRFHWIPPGTRARLERPDDYPDWGREIAPAPLFEGLS